ncbi:hypothetical protein CHU95_20445 [Niveispirillum lacus]|uniref:DUF3667 domain-containing protein n=1 Tax=Niveispirillum lacus TaxID=1981099 RepID=A0A255YQM6_9PROT|nr:DUF3667 domain-containing protein [Niveispirillum lacus]OYQ31517.1 hypothetical protein CHU95_20445 [Niveispirillum lacus]
MSDGIESVGAMATAGMAAAAIEGESGKHGHGAHGVCANCGTVLTGDFCHACGQAGHLHRSMLHIVEEFFHGILHFDSKAWRTLPLLAFRPGKLTYDYIHGHRARYVTPMAMFLFSVFLMFMSFSLLGVTTNVPVALPVAQQQEALAQARQGLEEARADLAEAEAELAQALSTGEDVTAETRQRDKAQRRLETALKSIEAMDAALAAAGVAIVPPTPPKPGEPPTAPDLPKVVTNGPVTTENLSDVLTRNLGEDLDINIGNPELEEKIKKKLKNPELLLYKMQNTAYKFSWILIPISLPFLWLLFFWKRGVAMYDHAIFSLYSLSFMSLLFITLSLVIKFAPTWEGVIAFLILLAPPLHMFFHLRGTYRLSIFSALWRTVALLFITLATSVLFVMFIVSMGVAG